MSDAEEESFGFYGKPLEQYDEDAIPKKRPISVEDQIATDTQGRRRFHGAFTGGFSAGFFNTVGSADGWTPTEFKSSRAEKADQQKVRRPEDYMDDEDVGEFGIAPQTVRATKDYNTSKKRKKQVFSDGPIPGDPVLHSLIENSSETIGYILLRNMGFKHTPAEDVDDDAPTDLEGGSGRKVYGCEMPRAYEVKKSLTNVKAHIPDIYKAALSNPKANSFGLGYVGLDKGHVELFTPSNLVVKERNNKKLSIAGQAFGVGAFENEDEDIYFKEDLSKYDFELTAEKQRAAKQPGINLVLKLFVPGKEALAVIQNFPPPVIPHSFTGKHKVKKSRFEPVIDPKEPPKRHEINASTRANALGEPVTSNESGRTHQPTRPKKRDIFMEIINKKRESKFDVIGDEKPKLEDKTGLSGFIFDKFVPATKSEDHLDILEPVQGSGTTHGTQDMREAASMKMFGPLTRVVSTWYPVTLVYRRFNIPDPVYSETEMKPKTRGAKNLIFQSEKFTIDPITIRSSGLQTTNNDLIANESSVKDLDRLNVDEVILNPMEVDTVIIDSDTSGGNKQAINASNNVGLKSTSFDASSNGGNDMASTSFDFDPNKLSTRPLDGAKSNAHSSGVNNLTTTKPLDITEKIDISKNVDLFKAVFLDSEDEASDNERQAEPESVEDAQAESAIRDEAIKAQVLSDDLLLPKISTTKAGILSNIDFDTFRPRFEKKQELPVVAEKKEDPNLYGPRLPEKIVTLQPARVEDSVANDDWIEKGGGDKKEHKHKKKSKKEKHKKKHKHKR